MSRFTTEVRNICEFYADKDTSTGLLGVDEVIQKALPFIFDFTFPIFDENYRQTLEIKIIKHYYTREIGFETVALWKLKLGIKLNEIMPYYNKLYKSELLEFNPLITENITKNGTRNNDSTSNHNDKENETNSTVTNNWNVESDTPQGGLSGVINDEYLSYANKQNNTSNSDRNKQSNSKNVTNNNETWEETTSGYSARNPTELLQSYRESFLNIDMLVISELDNLFMGVW